MEEESQIFRSCNSLLHRLMEHKYDEPVNPKVLGVLDYFNIIKRPMDLGTVKSRLAQHFYKSPNEFADDVRLTFHNAMTYNPKGNAVHVMAETLLNIFEERWAAVIEFESNNIKMGEEIDRNRMFRSLLQKLMEHKYGWVFNKPVNPKVLGILDYFDIIKHPMDLGTVMSRLAQDFYKSPNEFANDVRLTFHNAMTYNPKGNAVHVMAETLLNIFEERWAAVIEFKSNNNKMGEEIDTNRMFRSLLQRLMEHKYGWVFNKPVNPKVLGILDYFDIIKRPMDLGTVMSRLAQDFYKYPNEFADDVRLTFYNAMTYNPKGNAVHVMAETLLNIFEERWAVIESVLELN